MTKAKAKKKAKVEKVSYPDVIYVQVQDDYGDKYLVAHTDLDGFAYPAEEKEIGVYKLDYVATLKVNVELV